MNNDVVAHAPDKGNTVDDLVRGRLAYRHAGRIARRSTLGVVPLSLTQVGVWLHSEGRPEIPVYNESITIHHKGDLDPDGVRRALTEIVRRHEIWRTTFDVVNGVPVQIVKTQADFQLRVVDLRQSLLDIGSLEKILDDAKRPFNLRQGPLLRATLVRNACGDCMIFFVFHQIILDGVSAYQIFLPEFATLYEQFCCDRGGSLPEPAVQFSDYALWQRATLANVMHTQKQYWAQQLAGPLPVLQWPPYGARCASQSFRGAIYKFTLPQLLSQNLKAFTRNHRATFFSGLMAGFTTMLYAYTGQTDFIIGTVSPAGRKRPEVQHTIGYFLNPVALRIRLGGDPSFIEVIRRSQEVLFGAICHDDLPFESVVEQRQGTSDPSRHPLFHVAISQEPPIVSIENWDLTPMDLDSGAARWDFYLVVDDRPSGVIGRVQYNPELFNSELLDVIILDFQRTLETMLCDPHCRISSFKGADMVSAAFASYDSAAVDATHGESESGRGPRR